MRNRGRCGQRLSSSYMYRLARTIILIVAVFELAHPSVEAGAADRVALVIGNGAYAHAPTLESPLFDARDIGAALGRLGFEVMMLEDVDQLRIRRGLQTFARAASASDAAVVFFSGYGIAVDGRNFLIPVDARLANEWDIEFEAVPLDLVTRTVERAPGLRLVILDASRDNRFVASMQDAGASRSIGRGLGTC